MPREVPGGQRERGKGAIPVQVCDWTGCHFLASEAKFSQDGLPRAYGTAVSGWSEQGEEWGDFLHCLPLPWLEALHGAWIPLHFWIETARLPGGSCDLLYLRHGSEDESWRPRPLAYPRCCWSHSWEVSRDLGDLVVTGMAGVKQVVEGPRERQSQVHTRCLIHTLNGIDQVVWESYLEKPCLIPTDHLTPLYVNFFT